MVTVVVLGAVGVGLGVCAGALLLVVLAASAEVAETGRRTVVGHGAGGREPLVGARHAQFGDATAAAHVDEPRALRLVPPPALPADQPQPLRAA